MVMGSCVQLQKVSILIYLLIRAGKISRRSVRLIPINLVSDLRNLE